MSTNNREIFKRMIENDEIYAMSARPRGLCLFINNIGFKENDVEAKGAAVDAKNIIEMFEYLGFDVIYKTKVNSTEMEDLLGDILNEKEQFENHNAFAFVLLGIGDVENEREYVMGFDNKKVWIEKLKYKLSNNVSEHLDEKPKIVFVHLRKGDDLNKKPEEPVAKPKSAFTSIGDNFDGDTALTTYFTDFFASLAIHKGRIPDCGSFYCNALRKIIMERAAKDDIFSILRLLEHEIEASQEKKSYCQPIEIRGVGLRKYLFLWPSAEEF